MSMIRDRQSGLKPYVGFAPQALSGTTDITGEEIDTRGYDTCTFVLTTDAIAATSLDAQLEITECATSGGTFTAVADVDLIGTEANTAISASDDKVAKKIGYKGNLRYLKANLVVTANDGTDSVACTALLGMAHQAPVAQ